MSKTRSIQRNIERRNNKEYISLAERFGQWIEKIFGGKS